MGTTELEQSAIAKQTLIDLVREAGVVGEGGAGFPCHVKYDTRVETVIANGCECEPLLYSDQHIMIHHAPQIVRALLAVKRATGAERGVIAFKRKYHDVRSAFAKAMAGTDLITMQLDNFYPAGDEHILVHEVTGRSIPPLGLPKEVGALVSNVGTLYSVSNALDHIPVTRKYVTVTGEVRRPGVLHVPVGTSLTECLAQCGGESVERPVYIIGGPMMGKVLDNAEQLAAAVVTKTTGGIVVLPHGHYLHEMATLKPSTMQKRAAVSCIQCRYCTELCPRYLIGHEFETHKVMRGFSSGMDAALGTMQAHLCCECGVCEVFSCPMGLSPRRINALLKEQFRKHDIRFNGPRAINRDQADLRPYRKLPTTRLATKTDLTKYMKIHPEFIGSYTPETVNVTLQQHIGAPSIPTVKTGDRVNAGDCVGDIPAGALGARIHAPISGMVIAVDNSITIKGARRGN